MPGVVKGHPHATSDRHGAAEADRPARSFERAFGVGLGIQRLDARLADPVAPAVLPLGVLSWMCAESSSMSSSSSQVASVAKIGPLKPSAARRGSRPLWSRWAWEMTTASMLAGSKGEGRAVAVVGFCGALAHAAFEQDLHAIEGFQQITGASDLLGGAQKRQ